MRALRCQRLVGETSTIAICSNSLTYVAMRSFVMMRSCMFFFMRDLSFQANLQANKIIIIFLKIEW